MEAEPTVFIIDDDPAVRQALTVLVRSMHLRAEAYESAQQFLDTFDSDAAGMSAVGRPHARHQRPGTARTTQPRRPPTAGHRHVGLRRRADGGPGDEGRGAEFSGKTLPRPATLGGDPRGPASGTPPIASTWFCAPRSLHRLQRLTPGEHEVLRLLIDGKSNKTIAAELNVSVRTIEVRRAKLMKKMKAESLAELIRLTLAADPHYGKPQTPTGIPSRID